MSTSTNLNYRQSSGVTPTPSRPTSSHSPTHSAGTMHSPGPIHATSPVPVKKDEAFQKAIQKYVVELSDGDKKAFLSAPNVIEHLQEMQRNGKPLISSSLTGRVEKVLQCVKHFMSSLVIFIQQSPETSSLVVGGVNCILTVDTPNTF